MRQSDVLCDVSRWVDSVLKALRTHKKKNKKVVKKVNAPLVYTDVSRKITRPQDAFCTTRLIHKSVAENETTAKPWSFFFFFFFL